MGAFQRVWYFLHRETDRRDHDVLWTTCLSRQSALKNPSRRARCPLGRLLALSRVQVLACLTKEAHTANQHSLPHLEVCPCLGTSRQDPSAAIAGASACVPKGFGAVNQARRLSYTTASSANPASWGCSPGWYSLSSPCRPAHCIHTSVQAAHCTSGMS